MRDGVVRILLTVIAAALLALLGLEAGVLPRSAGVEPAAPPLGRFQFAPVRYGQLGSFLVRLDTASGKIERVRFPASDMVWEEVGVLPPGKTPKPDPLTANTPPLPTGLVIGPGGVLQAAPDPAKPGAAAGTP